MKKKTFLGIVIAMLVVLGLYVVDDNFVFYDFKESIADKSISLEEESSNNAKNQLLWFEYNNNHITLNRNVLLSDNKLEVYALNSDESINPLKVSSENSQINESCSGSFLATLSKENVDIDSDGKKESLFVTAKTDTLQTQGYNVVRTNFTQEDIPIEIVLANGTDITVYVNGVPLANQTINITSARGLDKNYTTDENGQILGLKIKDVRSGINISYEDENNNYYISSYIVESRVLFTALHFEAMIPLLYCILISAVVIAIICILRKYKFNLA